MSNKENLHGGHRQRLKNRFLEEGLEHFDDHQVLELLLFYCIPRQDTNPIAHALLDHFGSLSQVMEAPPSELQKIPGMGEASAAFLSLINSFTRYYQVNRASSLVILNTLEQCGSYLMPFFYGRRNETVYLLCLDAKCKVLCCKEVGEGSVNSASVPIRRIVEMALGANATSAILAHNHPSGLAFPSDEDQLTTRQLAIALAAVDITLVDHMIIADDEFVSLRQSGRYNPDDCRLLL
ncbi:MAG: DNA repair protein RadC [Ruminococcaceae bacterium]|nr:DNA repair protein RadC [Oscillospiraceae bacterium]